MNEWLAFSLILLGIWLAIYIFKPALRRRMLWVSALTAPFGLTEPIFVPEYWSPPSLFNLARETGFDIESLIFCFAIGGIGSVLYGALTDFRYKKMERREMEHSRHRWHWLALKTPVLVFLVLFFFTDMNPIYPGIIAMFSGGIAATLCRPDLTRNVWIGGALFGALYFVFFLSINLIYPDFLHNVWNMEALTGFHLIGVPLEEILFGFTFGMMWSGVYEHLLWYKTDHVTRGKK